MNKNIVKELKKKEITKIVQLSKQALPITKVRLSKKRKNDYIPSSKVVSPFEFSLVYHFGHHKVPF